MYSHKTIKCGRGLFLMIICLVVLTSARQSEGDELSRIREELMMREIGHAMLKCMGDQSSRVLPIMGDNGHFKISFSTDLIIDPEDMIRIFDTAISTSGSAYHLFVEIEQCESKEVHHVFEINSHIRGGVVACGGRVLPEDCYNILVTTVPASPVALTTSSRPPIFPWLKTHTTLYLLLLGILISLIMWRLNTRRIDLAATGETRIGASQYNPKTMILSYGQLQTSLSHKEAMLLQVLHNSANATVERENLLKEIWGDNGHYRGRTLDVFISKLRKKLEPDSSMAIVNVRGVGYKLVIQ